jgi:hypothetical protein
MCEKCLKPKQMYSGKGLYVITNNVIFWLMWLSVHFASINTFGCCYHLVNVISFMLHKAASTLPGYSIQSPGYSSTKKIFNIPGYPGNRYSSLDTLHTYDVNVRKYKGDFEMFFFIQIDTHLHIVEQHA